MSLWRNGFHPGRHSGLKDPVLPHLRLRFNSWPGNVHMSWVPPKKKKWVPGELTDSPYSSEVMTQAPQLLWSLTPHPFLGSFWSKGTDSGRTFQKFLGTGSGGGVSNPTEGVNKFWGFCHICNKCTKNLHAVTNTFLDHAPDLPNRSFWGLRRICISKSLWACLSLFTIQSTLYWFPWFFYLPNWLAWTLPSFIFLR